MQGFVDKLAAFGGETKDHLFVVMLLNSLLETYSTLITTLESRPKDELTLELVKSKVMNDYKKRKGVQNSKDSNSALKALLKKNAKKHAEKSCFCCKKLHYKRVCYK